MPVKWKNRRLFIVFDGVMTDATVSVNGKQAGEIHQGAFYQFKREITDFVKVGEENQLEVEVSKMSANESVNSAERQADFWVFGGIFRPVYLEAVPQKFVEYTGIDAKHDGSIQVEVVMDQPIEQTTVEVDIFESTTNKKVGSFQKITKQTSKKLNAEATIKGIKAWSAETPHLYNAQITVRKGSQIIHTQTERFGFRTIEVRERDGVYINNKKIQFKGVNRHSFWPTTGRTVNREQSLQDIQLIKEMNMNAVRMSHYPPDKHFLELCYSLGLYVINELCTWQKPTYDTQVGTILVNELIKRDINHPSVVMWANGNEGGFNRDLDPLYPQIDIQQRPVIHPFGLYNGINTVHYISYNSGIKNMFNGRDIFMPTEILHGLYDGGHGAGLDDYWSLMANNPLSAGLFLWVFADEGIVRTDQNSILDTDHASGADGIVGPYREKEGSFYTIKEIWSPISVEKKYLTQQWDGQLTIENRYDFTNASSCNFSYKLKKFESLQGSVDSVQHNISPPNLTPGDEGTLQLDLPENWSDYDFLYLTIHDKNGMELFTWSFEIQSPAQFTNRILKPKTSNSSAISKQESEEHFVLKSGETSIYINKITGLLDKTISNNEDIPLTNGPVFITNREVKCTSVSSPEDNNATIHVNYDYKRGGRAYRFSWTMLENGLVQLDYNYRPNDRIEMSGITFSFPEEDIDGATLLANGPYRVYKNRMKGGTINRWEKQYNDGITGEVWDYPEFKGYYSLFYGMKLHGSTSFEVYSGSEDLFLHLFTPTIQQNYDPKRNHTFPPYPSGDISFLDAIPPVGTKFAPAENFGPQSQKHRFKGFSQTRDMNNRLYFRF